MNMYRKARLVMVAALAAAALTFGIPASPAMAEDSDVTTGVAVTSVPAVDNAAIDDIQPQVRRELYPSIYYCQLAGALGKALDRWDRWLCVPQILGWRLYTNR
jgi:hypothetical protein